MKKEIFVFYVLIKERNLIMAEEGKKVFTVNPNGKKVKIIVGVCVALLLIVAISIASVSYTHLDVYKRQAMKLLVEIR